ncbi:hypothetical protein BDN71DRAFT_541036 [Pleurotus eryngii]|uniref:Uncharacterized protein n=1 Tax=Pleurotus eryngii TaxID=5323 RepID=A0A9P6D9X8_PLEER|nr:hypothetical protein BDN71DRAFT_541036 [Pleurotus eryngii]
MCGSSWTFLPRSLLINRRPLHRLRRSQAPRRRRTVHLTSIHGLLSFLVLRGFLSPTHLAGIPPLYSIIFT